ncbi:MAG: glycosyltransferase family 1 protein [Planctomycetia bacterium]|nr:glycosyltransferase family 1 protein [Planctomycetia bacterium]
MSDPLRILQVVTTLDSGGIENLLMNLYRQIDRDIIQFDFLVHMNKHCFFDDEIESLGGIIHRVPKNPYWKVCQQMKAYDQFFREHPEYNIVHSHLNLTSFPIIYSAWKAHCPVRIVHAHSANVKLTCARFFKRCAFMFINTFLTHRFACSQEAAKWTFRSFADNVTILNNGVQLEKLRFRSDVREKIRLQLNCSDKFVVGHVGNFTSCKNYFFLIDCFRELKLKRPDSFLLLVGNGTLYSEVEKKVNEYKLNDSVLMTGIRKDVPDLLQAMDIFVFPSLSEGLPVSLVEAQAAGLPSFISDAITKEVIISPFALPVSLKKNASEWATFILSKTPLFPSRKEGELFVLEAGYNIKDIANQLVQFYQNEWKKATE